MSLLDKLYKAGCTKQSRALDLATIGDINSDDISQLEYFLEERYVCSESRSSPSASGRMRFTVYWLTKKGLRNVQL